MNGLPERVKVKSSSPFGWLTFAAAAEFFCV